MNELPTPPSIYVYLQFVTFNLNFIHLDIAYGTLSGGSTMTFFRDSKIDVYKKVIVRAIFRPIHNHLITS